MRGRVLVLLIVLGTVAFATIGESATGQRQLRVGFVVGAGDTPDRSQLFGLPYDGFIKAVKAYDLEGRVLQVAPNQDAQAVLTFLARQKYDLVIMGLPDPWSVAAVAPKYPDTKFLLPDFSRQELLPAIPRVPKNVQGTVFRAQEAGYLAGYLAALMEKRRPGRDVIGSVGGYKFQGVDRWIVGYEAGAKKAVPGINILRTYAKSFSNPEKCRAVALEQIAKGAGVIFNVAGGCGFGALAVAKERGVWGVGVDVDQSYLGPHILTSAVIRLDVPVFDAIRRLAKGTFTTGGNTVVDLRSGGVRLGKISPQVPRSVLRQVAGVRREIMAGKIQVP
jgi:basic membrane protein A and related proteins